jgi:hypothetical protein
LSLSPRRSQKPSSRGRLSESQSCAEPSLRDTCLPAVIPHPGTLPTAQLLGSRRKAPTLLALFRCRHQKHLGLPAGPRSSPGLPRPASHPQVLMSTDLSLTLTAILQTPFPATLLRNKSNQTPKQEKHPNLEAMGQSQGRLWRPWRPSGPILSCVSRSEVPEKESDLLIIIACTQGRWFQNLASMTPSHWE